MSSPTPVCLVSLSRHVYESSQDDVANGLSSSKSSPRLQCSAEGWMSRRRRLKSICGTFGLNYFIVPWLTAGRCKGSLSFFLKRKAVILK